MWDDPNRQPKKKNKIMNIQRLPETFRKYDCMFVQLERNEYKALYERTYIQSGVKNWEVITLKPKPSLTVIDGAYVNDKENLKEHYPSDEMFGQNGWWFTSYDRAKKYYDGITPFLPSRGAESATFS